MPVEITPIVTPQPVVVPQAEEKVFDTWFLTDFRLVATPDRKFDAEIFWALGRYYTVDVQVPREETTTEPVLDGNGNPVMTEQRDPQTNEIIYETDPETGLPTENPVMIPATQTVTNTVYDTVQETRSEFNDRRGVAYIRDILSDSVLAANPEVAAILPGFLGAITAASARTGAISVANLGFDVKK